jgi:hypothetical protein
MVEEQRDRDRTELEQVKERIQSLKMDIDKAKMQTAYFARSLFDVCGGAVP